MKKKYYVIILLFLVLSSFSLTDLFYKKTYVYKNTTGRSQNKTSWLIKKRKDDFIITKTSNIGMTNILYSPQYILKEMAFKSAKENSDYKFYIDHKKLIMHGKTNGRNLSKKFYLRGRWVQDFNFGLRPLLESKKSKYHFITINPDDFTTNDLVATKEGIVKVKIGGKIYNAQKVEVTLTGFKSLFWKAEIWYDLDTFDLIRYRANEGPGTPVSNIVLDSKSK